MNFPGKDRASCAFQSLRTPRRNMVEREREREDADEGTGARREKKENATVARTRMVV